MIRIKVVKRLSVNRYRFHFQITDYRFTELRTVRSAITYGSAHCLGQRGTVRAGWRRALMWPEAAATVNWHWQVADTCGGWGEQCTVRSEAAAQWVAGSHAASRESRRAHWLLRKHCPAWSHCAHFLARPDHRRQFRDIQLSITLGLLLAFYSNWNVTSL